MILSLLLSLNGEPTVHLAVVKKETPSIESAAVDAFVRLVILASGKPVHTPTNYTNQPSLINPDVIHAGNMYQQWEDVLNVLSEYNSREEILLKYLTIYHVIENFMFKLPIVELERQQGGNMFSIRDFRRLYKQVEVAETTALQRLFKIVLAEPASPGVSFAQRIVNRWTSLVPNVAAADIQNVLGLLGIKKMPSPSN